MWTEANVQGLTRTTSSPVSLAWGGSPLPRLKSKKCSLAPLCGRVWTSHTGLWCHHTEIPHGEHPVLHATCLDCVPVRPSEFQGSSFCVASGASSLLSSVTCRCGQPLHSRGHHRGASAHAGVLGRRGFPLESCAARICREAGARVSVNVRVQDLDLHPGPRADNRRLEVVADGLPLFQGAQLAVDTTMVSTARADGAFRRQCAERDGAALDQARRTKERTHPELTGEHGRARLVVLACETGGRWSEEAQSFLRHLARARARSEPRGMRLAARRAWLRRWCTALACCAAQAFASSLLERRGGLGADGEIPSTSDVIWGDRWRLGGVEPSFEVRDPSWTFIHSFTKKNGKRFSEMMTHVCIPFNLIQIVVKRVSVSYRENILDV